MQRIVLIACVLATPSFAYINATDAVNGREEIVVRDAKGTGFTDLRMLYRKIGCIERTPKVDRKTLANAKIACQAIGGRLPKLSEVNRLAAFLSENYYLNHYDNDKSVLKSRFLEDDRFFWTETLKQERYVYYRALASLYQLEHSADMSTAKVKWETTLEDGRHERPYLCVFPK